MSAGKPVYKIIAGPVKRSDECILKDQGGLGGYCAGCGLMLMKHETGPCPKCGAAKRTNKKPSEAGRILAVGYTRFTQYTGGNEKI